MTKRDQIINKAILFLKEAPQGIRYSELVHRLGEALPGIPKNTIHGTIWNLEVTRAEFVTKPARGVYLHTFYKEAGEVEIPSAGLIITPKIKEEDYYKSFAEYIVVELEECTRAIPVGGNIFKDKWGTPDVIGIRKSKESDVIKFPTEILSAEIKLDSSNLITAFGQACAYRLFSHKSYIVVPKDSPPSDLGRLDVLSRIFGIGLILFDSKNVDEPNYEIRVRATKHDPDMFYVNKCIILIEKDLF